MYVVRHGTICPTISGYSYLVVRAPNEKLAQHHLSYQPVAAGPQAKLLAIKVLV